AVDAGDVHPRLRRTRRALVAARWRAGRVGSRGWGGHEGRRAGESRIIVAVEAASNRRRCGDGAGTHRYAGSGGRRWTRRGVLRWRRDRRRTWIHASHGTHSRRAEYPVHVDYG